MKKVDVIQLRGKWPQRTSDYAIDSMVDVCRKRGWDVHHPRDVWGSAMMTRSRNLSLRHIRPDSDYVLFVDDDMNPTPGALTRLIGHSKPVVSALCTTRSFPPQLVAKHYDVETDEFSLVVDFEPNVLSRGPWHPGFAFTVIQRQVIDAVREYVLEADDWLELNRRSMDRLRVRTEAREAEQRRISAARRRLYETEGLAPVFQMPLHDQNQFDVGEDAHFFRLLHLMGVPVWIDSGCTVGHIGEFPYTPAHCGIRVPDDVPMPTEVR